jgi:hypothetical protein
MCDYSLHAIASRPAKIGERLVSTIFPHTATRGFASVDDCNTAVCLLPGTELAFDENVEFQSRILRFRKTCSSNTATFRVQHKDQLERHHDTLELVEGRTVLVTDLSPGQYVTVLQLPVRADKQHARAAHAEETSAQVDELARLF